MSIIGTLAASLGSQVAKEVLPDVFSKLARGRGKAAERVAEVAADVVLAATGMAPDTPPENVLTVLRNDPEAYARVREAVATEAVAEIRAETRALEIAAEDRDSARQMQAQLKSGVNLALVMVAATLAFCGLAATIYMSLKGVALEGTSAALLTAAITASLGYLSQVMNFYFGSSAGSKAKTDAMSTEISNLSRRS